MGLGLVLVWPSAYGWARTALGAGTLALAAACAAPANTPGALADRITRAVYANDIDTVTAQFDESAKRSISRADLGSLADRMHALGALQGLGQRSADPDAGRYEYDAKFTGGELLVRLRVDPSGKAGAYRVTPESGATAP